MAWIITRFPGPTLPENRTSGSITLWDSGAAQRALLKPVQAPISLARHARLSQTLNDLEAR